MKFKKGDIVKLKEDIADPWIKRIDEVVKVGRVESGTRNDHIEWIVLKSHPVMRHAEHFELYERKEDI